MASAAPQPLPSRSPAGTIASGMATGTEPNGRLTALGNQLIEIHLDSLAALLESHFGYEERKLAAALSALDADAGTAEDPLGG